MREIFLVISIVLIITQLFCTFVLYKMRVNESEVPFSKIQNLSFTEGICGFIGWVTLIIIGMDYLFSLDNSFYTYSQF